MQKEAVLENIKTIPQAFLEAANTYLENPCLIYKKEHTFGYVPYKRLLNLVENFTLSLQKLGVKQGDRVAILSENRPEWAVSDLSTISLGAIFVPIHTTLTSEQIRDIILEIEPKIIIVSEKRLLAKLIEIKKAIERKVTILYYNIDLKEDLSEFKSDKCHFIEALKLMPHENNKERYRQIVHHVNPGDTASILYTIGPNGKYRGVELSHKNIISNVKGTVEAIYAEPDDKFLSVLPLSHALEKTAGYYVPVLSGSSVVYLTELPKFSQIAKEYKPTVIIGVPRLYEKTYTKIQDKVSRSRLKKFLVDKALDFGGKKENRSKITYKLYDQLVYRRIRKELGGNIRLIVSGGAALSPKVGMFFDASGIPILEGYGLTELSPIVSVNRLENNKLGTVGTPLPNTQVRIADDGEILIKSPGIMKGYYNNGFKPERYLEKGWFKTGDLGEFDRDGFLRILGRKKEVIVLSTGKNVSPRSIESQLTLSKYIKQAAVVGDGQKHIAALIVPDFVKLGHKFGLRRRQEIINNPETKNFLQQEIDKRLHGFSRHEQIKKFALISNAFTVQNRFLNDDSSLNRDKINAVYSSVIAGIYSKER